MQKIEFKDLPSTDTPINSDNLNLLQTNVENAINEIPNCNLFGLGTSCIDISNQDLNTYLGIKNGFYVGKNLTNSPSTSVWFIIIHLAYNESYQRQILFNISSDTIYTRRKTGGTWQDWRSIVNNAITL